MVANIAFLCFANFSLVELYAFANSLNVSYTQFTR